MKLALNHKALKRRRSRKDRSAVARLLEVLKAGGDTRLGKVRRLKQSVRRRQYENDLKLTIAADRMVREMAG